MVVHEIAMAGPGRDQVPQVYPSGADTQVLKSRCRFKFEKELFFAEKKKKKKKKKKVGHVSKIWSVHFNQH